MEVPYKIRYAAKRLREGHRVNRVTVRDFLSHFGAERRGAVVVEAIQNILDSLGSKQSRTSGARGSTLQSRYA